MAMVMKLALRRHGFFQVAGKETEPTRSLALAKKCRTIIRGIILDEAQV